MADSGELERLVILAYDAPECDGTAAKEFHAYVNPAEVTLSYEMEYNSATGQGTTAGRMDFNRVKPGDLSLAFFLDGTGANGRPIDVQQQVTEFKDATGYNGEIHRTRYLRIGWGTLHVKHWVLKSASIAYKLFRNDGVPLRALITAAFIETYDDTTRLALEGNQSSDLTHVRLVAAGDTLPGLCELVYGEPRMCVEVARFNALEDFRRLQPGMRLRFPPLAK